MKRKKCIVYIGDFDLRNENVQAHLVKNNGKILNKLGYSVAYIGMNRDVTDFSQLESLTAVDMGENIYLELPNTLNSKGLFNCRMVIKRIITYMDNIAKGFDIEYVISYQAPTYAVILKHITKWCRQNEAKYIVNCADLPMFDSQPFIRRSIMKLNWHQMHKVNNKHADGIIAVSEYISKFYYKENRPTVIIPPLFDEEVFDEFPENEAATFLYAGTPFVALDKVVNPKGMKDRLDKVIDLFVELSKRNVKCRFLIVGITKEAYTTCVPRHRATLENQTQIEFMGRKPHNETLSILKSADFMINFRDKNIMTEAGLSTKVVESVSVGTPVVMNPIGDTFKYLKDGISGFTLNDDVTYNVELVKDLCNLSKADRCEIKNNCMKLRLFSLENYQENMISFLQNVKNKVTLQPKNDNNKVMGR